MSYPVQRVRAKKSGEPGWTWRRALAFPIIAFACWRLMEMENAPDTMVNQTIAWGWVIMVICLALFYTGFATAQDITAILATRTGLPYAMPPVAVDGMPMDDIREPPMGPGMPPPSAYR